MAPSPAAEYAPAELSRAFLGRDHWDVPAAILASVMRPRSRTAVKACHASSKSFTAADVVVLSLLAGGDVLTTAPTWEQVRTVLWGEVHRALYHLERTTGGLDAWDINQTEITTASGAKALGLSTNEGVRFQGWHARPGSFLTIVFDEAPGVRPDIYEAVEGIAAGGDVRILMLGNPVIASGRFFDVFATEAPGWERFTIDAFDTPNLAGLSLDDLAALPDDALDDNPRPYLVTRRWVRDRLAEWGEDHPLWQSRVRGRFPLQADDALISLAWLERAALRPAEYQPGVSVQAGVDVAGPGDDETVLCVRQGGAVLRLAAWSMADSRGAVIAALRPWAERGLDAVNVDEVGMGHYFASALEDEGLPVVRVNAGASPTDEKAKATFANLRAQLFWNLRDWASGDALDGITDRKAIAQMAGIKYHHDNRGRVVIERKEDARKRGVKSPDRAEAVALAFWAPRRSALAGVLSKSMARPTSGPLGLPAVGRPPSAAYAEKARRRGVALEGT